MGIYCIENVPAQNLNSIWALSNLWVCPVIGRTDSSSLQTMIGGGYIDDRRSFPLQDWWAGPDLNRRPSPREGDVPWPFGLAS